MVKRIISKYSNMPVQVKASFWFLVCSFMQKGVSTITTPIFTRLLTTAEYGNYNAFNSWLGIITIFVSLHLYSGLFTSGLVKFQDERSIFASSLQGLSTTLCLVWTVVYLMFRHFWNSLLKLTTVQMLAMLLMIWATAAFSFWAAEQRVDYRYKKLVVITLIVSILKPAVGIVFVLLADDKVTARILGLALVELIGYSGLFLAQLKRGKVFYSKKYWRYALMFNLPLIPHYLSQTVLNSADRIMIRDMVGSAQAGIYGLAYSVSQVMRLFNTALSNTISPWMYRKIRNNQVESIAGIAYISLIFIAMANLLLIALAPEIIAIFAPKPYYEAIWIVPPVAMSVYFIFMYDFFARFELYFERMKFMTIASIAGAILNVILNYVCIKKFGYLAAGYTTLICYILYVVGHYLCMNGICVDKLEGVKVYSVRKLVIISLGFMIVGFVFMFTYKLLILRYIFLLIFMLALVIKRKWIFTKYRNLMGMRRIKE